MAGFVKTLRTRSWQQHLGLLAGLSWLFLFSLMLVRDAELRSSIKLAWLAFLVLGFAAKEAVDAPLNWGRAARRFRAERRPVRALFEAIPCEIRGWFRTFWAWQLGFVTWLLDRMPPKEAGDPVTGYLRRSGYTSLLPMLVASSLVDIPLLHAFVEFAAIPAAQKPWLHLGALGLHVLAFTSLLGDRYLLGAGQHLATDTHLHIALGARAGGLIPLQSLAAVDRLRPDFKLGRLGPDEVVVSPWDAPNLMLTLSTPASLQVLGAPRNGLCKLYLYVDEPDAFVRQWQQGTK
jgi:hypothetical protein